MNVRLWSAAWAGVVAVLLVGPASGQMRDDQVFRAKGTPTRGRVSEVSRDAVTVEVAGNKQPVSVNEIVRVAFAEDPSDLSTARSAIIQKNYNQALQDLKKIDAQRIANPFVRQDLEYYKALCQAKQAMSEGGDKAAATEAMLNFVKAAPQSYHFYDAAEVLGDLAMSSGKWADAVKYYGPISNAPWAEYQMRANIALGRALIGEKQYDQALEKLAAVLTSDVSTPEALRQKNIAQVGKAVCLAETGKVAEGIALLQELINKNDPQDSFLFGRIYNALGRCYVKENKAKDAALAFLHTDILFYGDADAHAESLYYLSKLWPQINKSDRAITARNTLRERYAGSIWATQE
jgi:tetratricopeptide (TPR) repeat protein